MRLSGKLKNIVISFLFVLLLSGCSGDPCIDADDFGFAKVTISSRYPNSSNIVVNGQSVPFTPILSAGGQNAGAWIDSGYRLDGNPLTIMVKNWRHDPAQNNAMSELLSAWSPWFGKDINYNNLPNYLWSLRSCQLNCSSNSSSSSWIKNAPCLMTKGMGLYGLIVEPNFSSPPDPNATFYTRYDPMSFMSRQLYNPLVFHVGDPNNNAGLYDISTSVYDQRSHQYTNSAGGIVVGCAKDKASCSSSLQPDMSSYVGGNLYLKILDTDYSDNAGQYLAVIKSGVSNLGFNPFERLINELIPMIFGGGGVITGIQYPGVVKEIYTKILTQPDYVLTVRAILILFVLFTGMAFLIGVVRFTQIELFSRVFKIVLITILINSQISWDFFNTYLFNGFVHGLEYIKGIVQQAASGGNTQGPEDVVALILAEQTIAKLSSLLLFGPSGWVYFTIFLVLIGFILMMYLRAYVLYTTALLIMGMIIALAPIFLCFMLFGFTKSLYNNWLKKLIIYSFQPIILFASLAFLGGMVRSEVYSSLGFRVCQMPIITIMPPMTGPLLSLYYPQPQSASGFSESALQMMAVPISKVGDDGKFYPAYTYQEERYPAMPFLSTDPNNMRDAEKIKSLQTHGLTVDFMGLCYLILITMILSKFNNSTLDIANTIVGDAHTSALHSAGGGISHYQHSAMEYFARARGAIYSRMQQYTIARSLLSGRDVLVNSAKYYSAKISNNLGAPLAALSKMQGKEGSAQESQWLAKKLGVAGALKGQEIEQRLHADLKQSLLSFKKNSLDFKNNRLGELRSAKGGFKATLNYTGRFLNGPQNFEEIAQNNFKDSLVDEGQAIKVKPMVQFSSSIQPKIYPKEDRSFKGDRSLLKNFGSGSINAEGSAQEIGEANFTNKTRQGSEGFGDFNARVLSQVKNGLTGKNLYNSMISGMQIMINDESYHYVMEGEESAQKAEGFRENKLEEKIRQGEVLRQWDKKRGQIYKEYAQSKKQLSGLSGREKSQAKAELKVSRDRRLNDIGSKYDYKK